MNYKIYHFEVKLIPKQNKLEREISESEVEGAIKYLKSQVKVLNQLNVDEIVGCHFTIHKGFVSLYKFLSSKIKI